MKQLIINLAVAFSVFLLTSLHYRGKHLRFVEDYEALRMEHTQLVKENERFQREARTVFAELIEIRESLEKRMQVQSK